ncbi:MAG: outer membrane lipoprotein carrier protein LolA [Bacteroidota bacterium]
MRRILSLLIFSSSFTALGQQVNPEEIVKSFSNKMQEIKSLSATFNFTLENLQERITDTHQGKILAKGKMFYLDLMGMEVYSDGQTKWQYIKEAKEVTISKMNVKENSFLDDPMKLFKDYDKNFKYKYVGQQNIKNRVIHEVDFFPRDLNLPYSSVKLQFDANTLEPYLIRYQGKDGNNYIIQIKNFKSNVPLRDDRFKFEVEKHKGVEVVDMR